jgi:hypothetical protein
MGINVLRKTGAMCMLQADTQTEADAGRSSGLRAHLETPDAARKGRAQSCILPSKTST